MVTASLQVFNPPSCPTPLGIQDSTKTLIPDPKGRGVMIMEFQGHWLGGGDAFWNVQRQAEGG